MNSKSILLAWELGGGLGHLIRALPLVRSLRQHGHRVSIVARDMSRVTRSFAGLDVDFFQAPVKRIRPENRVVTLRNFAHILHNNGYADGKELVRLSEGWRSLYRELKPDLLLSDHSPTALVAARGLPLPVATIGTGFCCPPDVSPLPDFRPWMPDAQEQIRRDEAGVLERINQLLLGWDQPPLDRLSQLYAEVDECILATFAELDHYRQRRGGSYYGAWPHNGGDTPNWPQQGRGKRVFAYVKNFKALPNLLNLLTQFKLPSIVYCDRLHAQTRQRFASPTLQFADRRLDLAQVGQTCDFAILNAGHGATVSMLLAGKSILQMPLNLEQSLTALTTLRLGAGLIVEPNQTQQVAQRLAQMVNSNRFEGAQRFASRYAEYDPQLQIERIVGRLEQLLETDSENPSAL